MRVDTHTHTESDDRDAPLTPPAQRRLRPVRIAARVTRMIREKALCGLRDYARFWYCRYMTAA
jgi:hypothetical protein